MGKTKKLAIAFAISIAGSLLVPIFTQWYHQKTGIDPIGFYFVYALGSIFSIIAIASNNFKDF
jgi:hypothetical protein